MKIQTAFAFQSSSSAEVYQTLVYDDGSITCNCPGWTRRIVDGVRTCKHVRYVELGIGRNQCVSFKDYSNGIDIPAYPVVIQKRKSKPKPKPKANGSLFYVTQDYPETVEKPIMDRNIDFSAL